MTNRTSKYKLFIFRRETLPFTFLKLSPREEDANGRSLQIERNLIRDKLAARGAKKQPLPDIWDTSVLLKQSSDAETNEFTWQLQESESK